ncbi:MAG TPA: lysophospholipid acyltransferase family protein [Steroidobacteraceae bacterium]|nr:lysophospholipid acyltransferase family protein [Steroidobacteraceae bacterium]
MRVSVAAARLRPALRGALLGPARLAYALWALLAFLAVGVSAMVALAVLPGVARRRAAARACARAYLFLAATPLTLKFPERIPAGQCVVVCNHASYLDGVVLTAALPARFGFVIKREMSAVPLAGAVLRRLGSEFVERFNRNRGAADARRVLRIASQGHSLVFFPEGTFARTPGLLKFHVGAFASAARAGCPLVPAVLRGTRRALPPSGALPLPGRIELEILPALSAAVGGHLDEAAAALRDRARAAILGALGEPDLTCCADTARPPGTAPARSVRASRP